MKSLTCVADETAITSLRAVLGSVVVCALAACQSSGPATSGGPPEALEGDAARVAEGADQVTDVAQLVADLKLVSWGHTGRASDDAHRNFRLPLHMHPNGHEITYVVEGEQTFEIEGCTLSKVM